MTEPLAMLGALMFVGVAVGAASAGLSPMEQGEQFSHLANMQQNPAQETVVGADPADECPGLNLIPWPARPICTSTGAAKPWPV